MQNLVSVMVRSAQLGARRILRVPKDFESHFLCPGYPLAAWRNDPEVRLEERQFFNAVTSKVLYLDGLPHIEEQLTLNEYKHAGRSAVGLGVASALDSLAVSASSAAPWNAPSIGVERNWIELGDDKVLSTNEMVRHASIQAHVEIHSAWIGTRSQLAASDGADLWRRRAELLPGLAFCACVKEQLDSLGRHDVMLRPVVERLGELDAYARNWQAGPFDRTRLPSKVSPESQGTLEEHEHELTFLCPDGQTRLFSWHARMTPGEWRLHFYPDGETRRLIVGRIGRKPFI